MNEYFGLITWNTVAESCLDYLIATIVFTGISYLILRHLRRAAFLAGFLLFLYLFWGSFHDFLKSILPSFITSYTLLLPLIPLVTIFILIWQKKKKPSQISTSRFLNLLLIFLLIVELATTIYYNIDDKTNKIILTEREAPDFSIPKEIEKDSLPDIFLIVFDEYMSSAGIQKYLGYNNSSIDSFLLDHGFYVAGATKSNYNSTPHVIASALNMTYFPFPLEGSRTDPATLVLAQKAVQHAKLPKVFAESGYDIVNCGQMDLPGATSPTRPIFESFKSFALRADNFRFRVHNEIWWNFTQKFQFLRPSEQYWNKLQEKKTNTLHRTIEMLDDELQKTSSKPRFVIGHFLMPHTPYIFDSAGRSRVWDKHPQSMTDSLYFDQVKYANILIKDIVERASVKSDRKKVIIILGDHGLRDFHLKFKDRIREKEMMNFTAIYYDNKDYSQLYDSISPVNIFRTVLNSQFGTKLPMLKDSTILLQ